MPGYIEHAANQIADILMREGLDYTQTKAVFKQARAKAGLHAPKENRGSPARLTLKEELRFIDQAYAQGGQVGLDDAGAAGDRHARVGIRGAARRRCQLG